jgi:hypothetical protein
LLAGSGGKSENLEGQIGRRPLIPGSISGIFFSYEWFYSDLLNLIVTNVTILVNSKSFSQNNFLAVLIRFSLLIESKYYLLLQLDDDNAMNI